MNTPKNILAEHGFEIVYSNFSGICIYVKNNPIDKGYDYQINTEDFSVIDETTTDITFSINGKNSATHPIPKYYKEYKTLVELIKSEEKTFNRKNSKY